MRIGLIEFCLKNKTTENNSPAISLPLIYLGSILVDLFNLIIYMENMVLCYSLLNMKVILVQSVLINQFVPPTFCLCFSFTGINFRGMLQHVCDMAYDENRCVPIRTRKCSGAN